MAILGFHFSGVYKEKLMNGSKTATIMNSEHHFKTGDEVLVYISDKPNLFDGNIEQRIGSATIQETKVMKVHELTEPRKVVW